MGGAAWPAPGWGKKGGVLAGGSPQRMCPGLSAEVSAPGPARSDFFLTSCCRTDVQMCKAFVKNSLPWVSEGWREEAADGIPSSCPPPGSARSWLPAGPRIPEPWGSRPRCWGARAGLRGVGDEWFVLCRAR